MENFQHVRLERAESPEAPSPGQRPGRYGGIDATCKGKSIKKSSNVEMLLPLQGDILTSLYPGCYPGLGTSALSGRIGHSNRTGRNNFDLLLISNFS